MSHSTCNRSLQRYSLSRQSTGLVPTTENKETEYHMHVNHKKHTHEPALDETNIKLHNPHLDAFYDIQSENEAGLLLQPRSPARRHHN